MINPVFLRTFIHLVETNHFTQTAERLHMTQPGVSQHIKKLEDFVGKPLLTRFGKKFELTYAGECLYRFGLAQQNAESALFDEIASDNKFSGECKIACSGAMAMRLYPQMLELQQRYPKLSVSVESAPNAAIIRRVLTNESDIGLVTHEVHEPLLEAYQITQDRLCLLLPKNADSHWQNLLDLGFINHPDGHQYASALLGLNFKKEFQGMTKITQSGYVNQLSQILEPVARGLGFTVLQESALAVFNKADSIQNVDLENSFVEPVYFVKKRHRQLPLRYQLVTELLNQRC